MRPRKKRRQETNKNDIFENRVCWDTKYLKTVQTQAKEISRNRTHVFHRTDKNRIVVGHLFATEYLSRNKQVAMQRSLNRANLYRRACKWAAVQKETTAREGDAVLTFDNAQLQICLFSAASRMRLACVGIAGFKKCVSIRAGHVLS